LQKDIITKKGFEDNQQARSQNVFENWAPYCYLKNFEPINLMPNDNIKSQSFFFVNDPEKLRDEGPLVKTIFSSALVSLIVWGNINLTAFDSPEHIRLSILNKLKLNPKVIVLETFQNFDRVYDRFTITEEMINYNKLPFFAVRFDFNLDYTLTLENC
jgi:hypothetical protein